MKMQKKLISQNNVFNNGVAKGPNKIDDNPEEETMTFKNYIRDRDGKQTASFLNRSDGSTAENWVKSPSPNGDGKIRYYGYREEDGIEKANGIIFEDGSSAENWSRSIKLKNLLGVKIGDKLKRENYKGKLIFTGIEFGYQEPGEPVCYPGTYEVVLKPFSKEELERGNIK